MQTESPIELKMACTCTIEQTPGGWKRIGMTCPYCKAWSASLISQSMEPLKAFKRGLEQEAGIFTSNRTEDNDQA